MHTLLQGQAWAVHLNRSPGYGELITMFKPPTGVPCAGNPHAQFGGRGRQKLFPFPAPIKAYSLWRLVFSADEIVLLAKPLGTDGDLVLGDGNISFAVTCPDQLHQSDLPMLSLI